MAETMDSFFDRKKLYLKTVEQEANLRGNRHTLQNDPLLASINNF